MSATNQTPPTTGVVEVFWRPGCPYCAALRRGLNRQGVTATWRNIWEDPDAAEVVRKANCGAETVPTVRIGDRVLTNPRAAQVAAELCDLAPAPSGPAGSPGTAVVTATLGGTVIARSTSTIVVEGNHYFPIDDVNLQYLTRTRAKSLCPWKGIASYYTVTTVGGRASRNAAWTYLHPSPLARRVKHRVAFWGDVRVHIEQPWDRS